MPDPWWQAYYLPQSSLLPLCRKRRRGRRGRQNKIQTWRRACVRRIWTAFQHLSLRNAKKPPGMGRPSCQSPTSFNLNHLWRRWRQTLCRRRDSVAGWRQRFLFFWIRTFTRTQSRSLFVSCQQVGTTSQAGGRRHIRRLACGWVRRVSRSCDVGLKLKGTNLL